MWKWMVVTFTLCGMVLTLAGNAPAAQDFRLDKDKVKAMLGSPDVMILDVRQADDYNQSNLKIPGAVRLEPRDAGSKVNTIPKDKTLIFYCS